MPNYRKPTDKETEKLNKARKMMAEGIEAEKDIFSRTMPTMAKAARDEMRAAKALRETVPASAREGEAYQDAGYKKGGKVKHYNDGGISLEEQYPGAKITRLEPGTPPKEGGKGSEEHIRNLQALRHKYGNANANPELFEEKPKKSRGGGGGAMPKSNRDITKNYQTGGKVSSASKRADGIAIRGKTRA